MSVFKGILLEEHKRLLALMEEFETRINEFPKGSIIEKDIKGHKYAYQAYRSGKKIVFKYLGTISSHKAQQVANQIKERRDYEISLKKAKSNFIEVQRALNGIRRKKTV